MMAADPTHGWTRLGHAVHAKTVDHHPTGSAYQRFNQKVALWLTNNVGTMTCFWIVAALCVSVLPSVLFAMAVIPKRWGPLPTFLTGFGFELMMTWIVSTCFQALCLPAILVGQNLQTLAADARAAKTFEDVEEIRGLVNSLVERGPQASTGADPAEQLKEQGQRGGQQ